MITDSQTNIVYFSDLIKDHVSFRKIETILRKHAIKYGFIESTKDIWARDYMPIQINTDTFIQFKYTPSYLKGKYEELRSDSLEICRRNCLNPIFSDIILDGGNVVKENDRVLITDRIFTENSLFSNKNHLISMIENLLNAEVIIIPQIKSDFTGHADGLVRFFDSKTIIGNNLEQEFKYWSTGMKKVKERYGFDYINMPIFEYKTQYKNKSESAIGCYVNYLEIGNLIIFPVFELEGNKDDEALALISDLYPHKSIEPININEIAFKGGLMNCVSWNIKK